MDYETKTSRELPSDRLSPYNEMIVQSHSVSARFNILTAIANWVFLAGFVVLPGTFESLSRAKALSESRAGAVVQYAVRNSPLLYVGGFCCLIGASGIGWVWWTFRLNYVWLVDHLFL